MSARPVIMSTRSVIVRRLQYEGSRILNRTVSLLVLPFFEKRANVLKNCFTLMSARSGRVRMVRYVRKTRYYVHRVRYCPGSDSYRPMLMVGPVRTYITELRDSTTLFCRPMSSEPAPQNLPHWSTLVHIVGPVRPLILVSAKSYFW